MPARISFGRAWVLVPLAILVAACTPGDGQPLASLNEERPSVADRPATEPAEGSPARFGGPTAEFDDIVLFPVALQGPGLGGFAADCSLDDDPFSSCL